MEGRSYTNWPIKAHNLYLARQGGYDEEGRYTEVVGILDLAIPEVVIEGKKYGLIRIYFRSAGSRRATTLYGDNVISFEFSAEDMNAWISALNAPKKSLDIDDMAPKYLKIYLRAGTG